MKQNFFLFFTVAVVYMAGMHSVFANYDESASGWVWGGSEDAADGVLNGNETGVGWVSLNSINCDDDDNGLSDGTSGCPSSGTVVADYGVQIPNDDGDLSGHAWSENLGWISFASSDLGGCPSGTCSARRKGNTLKGWARVLSVRDATTNAGGFEGWIKLGSESGDSISYGTTITGQNPGTITGYAWSDEFGWIRFENVAYDNSVPILVVCPSAATITQGGTFQLTAYYVTNSDGDLSCSDVSGADDKTSDAIWSSANDAVASVDNGSNKGLVTGVAVGGPVTITAKHKGEEDTASITVNTTVNNNCGNGLLDGPDGIVGNTDDDACDDGAGGNGTCSESKACSAFCEINVCIQECSAS